MIAKSSHFHVQKYSPQEEECMIRKLVSNLMKAQKDVTYQICLGSILASSNELCCRLREGPLLCSALLRPHLECWVPALGFPAKEKWINWPPSHERTQRWWWCISSTAAGWELSLAQRRLGGYLIYMGKWLEGGAKMEPGSFLWCPINGHTLKRRRPCLYIRKHCHCEQDWALAQAVQGGWEFLQYSKVIWLWSWETGCRGSCLSMGIGWDDLQCFLTTSTTLWFRDSVILWYSFYAKSPLWRKYSNRIWVIWNIFLKNSFYN